MEKICKAQDKWKLTLEHETKHKTCKVQGDRDNLCTFNHLVVLC